MEPGGQRTTRFSGRQELWQGKYRSVLCSALSQCLLKHACRGIRATRLFLRMCKKPGGGAFAGNNPLLQQHRAVRLKARACWSCWSFSVFAPGNVIA